jgi:hypothetical protein
MLVTSTILLRKHLSSLISVFYLKGESLMKKRYSMNQLYIYRPYSVQRKFLFFIIYFEDKKLDNRLFLSYIKASNLCDYLNGAYLVGMLKIVTENNLI